MSYADYQVALGPPWLKNTAGAAWAKAHGQMKDALTDLLVQAVQAADIQTADEAALMLRGAERGLLRYPDEYLNAYRYRVLNSWDYWKWAGTVQGMLYALEHMGYSVQTAAIVNHHVIGSFISDSPYGIMLQQAAGDVPQPGSFSVEVLGETYDFDTLIVSDDYRYYALPPTRIIEHFHDDRSIWAEFSVFLTPSDASLNADAWDDGSRWDDDTLWDLTIRQEEIDRVRGVLNEIKPAHARLRGIYLVSQWQQDYWDDQTNWDDSSVWDEGEAVTLYQREGINGN